MRVSLEFNRVRSEEHTSELQSHSHLVCRLPCDRKSVGSEEHTSELQSHSHLVCRLLRGKRYGNSSRKSSCGPSLSPFTCPVVRLARKISFFFSMSPRPLSWTVSPPPRSSR